MPQAAMPLGDWLRRLETLSPHEIELGLDRVLRVLERMDWRRPTRVVHVAGTNGKGSSVAMLAALFSEPGRTVGSYTSPHVIAYNERICIGRVPASDAQIVAAFERVEAARGDELLTYFEFGTLAALAVFEHCRVDTAVLEIGMGGRLDAVNAVNPDASLITNVSLDHCAWLGNDIETIAFEKAGVMRGGVPVVYAGKALPDAVARHAAAVGADLIVAGRDYDWTPEPDHHWSWRGRTRTLERLALPSLAGDFQLQNAAGVLALVEALGPNDMPGPTAVDAALRNLQLPGRMQKHRDTHEWLLDVAHNPAAATALADTLRHGTAGTTVAILAMLDDKDVEGVVAPLDHVVDRWIAVTAASPRAIPADELARRVANCCNKACLIAETPDGALDNARLLAGDSGRVLVTGSFYIVGPVLQKLGL